MTGEPATAPHAAIVVFGAAGLVGRQICRALTDAQVAFEIAGRSEAPLTELARAMPVAHVHVADTRELASLTRAFAGARVVINAAGPLRESAQRVLEAALTAGAHYVDVGGEQPVLRELHERHESIARRSGLVAVPGSGVDCALGDLAAAWAAAKLCGVEDPGPAVRTEPVHRLAAEQPLDEVAVSYVFDELALSAGSQRALFGGVGDNQVVWRRDRWEPARAIERRRVMAGDKLGGEREAIGFAGGDAITIPRHVASNLVRSYVSTTRSAAATTAMRWLARAMPLVPRAASELLAPYAAPDADYTRTKFAVIAAARRGGATTEVAVRGRDLYRTTGAIAAWIANQLASRSAGPIGMCAPAELFRPALALAELAAVAHLELDAPT
ncbi:MAG: saccharopine dehydrogenase NADP-binding domain-containing protein [Kofleriaceae bacterium]